MSRSLALPVSFQPTSPRPFQLSDGIVRVSVVNAEFEPWPGPPLVNALGSKKVVASRGGPAFAELHIARLFEDAGWNARWVEPWTRPPLAPAFLTEWAEAERDLVTLKGQRSNPPGNLFVERALEEIAKRNRGTFAGVWDVLAWSGERILFVESKLRGHDSIKETQHRWLESALAIGHSFGIDESAFLIVEWSNSCPWPKRGRTKNSAGRPESRRATSTPMDVDCDVDDTQRAPVAGGGPTRRRGARAEACGPIPATRAEFEARFESFWRSLLERFRAGEELRFAPRSVGAGVGNRRRVVEMTHDSIQLIEEGPRASLRRFDLGEIEDDLWKLSQDPAVDTDSLKVLRRRHGIRYLVEFKRDVFEQFRRVPAP